jgi:hypothetical protein
MHINTRSKFHLASRSCLILSLLLCGCSSKEPLSSWQDGISIAQEWRLFSESNYSQFISRCVDPTVNYIPSNGRYLESHEDRKLLLRYMLNNCYEEAKANRAHPDYAKISPAHYYSWGFRLYFGKLTNLTKTNVLEDLSKSGGDLGVDIDAAERIAKIWADDGHTDSAFWLAAALMTKNPKKSFLLTKDAAIRGNCFAQAHLAYLYSAGGGVQPDPVNAYFWFSMAQGGPRYPRSSILVGRRDYPDSTNFYPTLLSRWFDDFYKSSVAAASSTDISLGRAIAVRGDFSCTMMNIYNPLPSALASAVLRLSNEWMVGESAPEELNALSIEYQEEAFARKSLGTAAGDAEELAPLTTPLPTPSFERLSFEADPVKANRLAPEELFELVANSVYLVYSAPNQASMNRGQRSTGTAVHVYGGMFLTNCHIFEGNSFHLLRVKEQYLEVEFTATDFDRDTCIFTVDAELDLSDLSFRSSSKLRIGEAVYAIGNPSGLQRTLSNGLVSATRQINSVKVIQTNTEISGGSSGGALFDQHGNLIGITSFGLKGAEGLNFAIAIEEFLELP